jgi:hypothetical protein
MQGCCWILDCTAPSTTNPARPRSVAAAFAVAAACVQDWTKIENEDAEGLVEVTYRSGSEPGRPPDIQIIQKKMAIVAWQPGPNRVIAVPDEVRLVQTTDAHHWGWPAAGWGFLDHT